MGFNVSKSLSKKFSQETLDHAKQSATETPRTTSKGAFRKTAKTTVGLICNKISKKIKKN